MPRGIYTRTAEHRAAISKAMLGLPRGSWYGKTEAERFWAKVNKDGPVPARRPELGPCWVWTSATNAQKPYGLFTARGNKQVYAHIWAYQEERGPVPDGLQLDHLCFNQPCVRPSHLEAVTSAENTRRYHEYRVTLNR